MGNRRGPDGKRLCAGSAWVKATAPFRRACQRQGAVCWVCHGGRGPIVYDGSFPRRSWFSVDHVVKIEYAPELAMEPTNWMPAHVGCNSGRSNRERARRAPVRQTSEAW